MRSHPVGHGLAVVELPLRGRPGVADQPGGTADEDDGLVAGPLQRPQHHELQQVPDVQARRGRVEAAVVGDRPLGEVGTQRGLVGALGDQPAAVQLVDHVVPSQGTILPGASARRGLPPARNTLTDGASVSQNRHGRSVAWLMPDPRPGRDRRRRRPPVQPHGAAGVEQVGVPVVRADAQRLGQPGRAAGEVPGHPGGGPAGPARAPPPPRPRRPAAAPPSPDPRGPTTTLAHQCTP